MMDDEDRTIDEQVAVYVLGWPCAHAVQPVTDAMRLADARAEFYERYGEHAPAAWKPEEHSADCFCRPVLTAKRFSGMWCPKCGHRGDDLRYMEYYSRAIGSAWRVVEAMQSRGMQMTLRTRSDASECEFISGILSRGLVRASTAEEAICLAALAAVGAPAPASHQQEKR